MWRRYILSSARPLLSSSLLQPHKRRLALHHGNKTQTSCLSFWSCSWNRKTTLLIRDRYKVSKLEFGLVGGHRFTVRATEVNDAGSIDSPRMQSMEKKVKEQLNAESVIVKDAYGDGRHVRNNFAANTGIHAHCSGRDSTYFDRPLKFQTCATSSIVQAKSLQHWFKNWKEKRIPKLTASTFGGAIGFWPDRRVQLWLEKLGAREPFSGNLATCWSNIKEEEALEKYKLITGNPILFPEFQIYGENNEKEDWLAASPDGVVDQMIHGLPSRGVLEIKCPFFNGDKQNALPWKRIPLYHIPQAQGLMEILDKDWMDFYVWTPLGSSLFRLYRDLEYWEVLKMALSDFWWKHVQPAKEEMCSKSVIHPLKELKKFKPAPRHELCSYLVYESRRIVNTSKLLIREIHGKLQD